MQASKAFDLSSILLSCGQLWYAIFVMETCSTLYDTTNVATLAFMQLVPLLLMVNSRTLMLKRLSCR